MPLNLRRAHQAIDRTVGRLYRRDGFASERERIELLFMLYEKMQGPLAAVPRQAADDAAHIAISATNGVDFLVTWNFRHIANAAMRARIERVCRQEGYDPPVICTPNELTEANNGNAPD